MVKISDKIQDMKKNETRKRLLEISNLVSQLLGELEAKEDQDVPPPPRTHCPVCHDELSVEEGEEFRGVHEKCYKRIQRRDEIQKAEREGILLPKKRPGRKQLPGVDEVVQRNLEKTREFIAKETGKKVKKSST